VSRMRFVSDGHFRLLRGFDSKQPSSGLDYVFPLGSQADQIVTPQFITHRNA
jgi:hypothetical protein